MRVYGFWRSSLMLGLLVTSTCSFAAPHQIALLLPQSGRMAKAAESIRNGFLAAYYQDSAGRSDSPSLHFYDSDATDIVSLVNQAKADGADFIIGPLDRERVDTLIAGGPIKIPVLALNRTEAESPNLAQFALSPEDEMQTLVAWMQENQIRHPLILTSADDASQRQQRLFLAAWPPGLKTKIPVLLLDPARKGGIVGQIKEVGSNYDALFLASPNYATQVQPALTYYHNPTPLYSLSSVWDPIADASGQHDLDGVRFCDLPWMVEAVGTEQAQLYESFGRPIAGYDRLHAFGADAWTLSQQWSAILDGESISLRSGSVRADTGRHLRRVPSCAEVRNGTAILIRAGNTGRRTR